MSGATVQKIRRAKELDGRGGEVADVECVKRVSHVSPTPEQSTLLGLQPIGDSVQACKSPVQTPANSGKNNAALGGGEGRNVTAGMVGNGKRVSRISPTPQHAELLEQPLVGEVGQSPHFSLQFLTS